MSLRLCRSEKVKNPYYVSFLGVHLYSSQELAYVIYHYPLLVMDHLVDDRLLDFLREELNLGFLALKLENWRKSGEDLDEMLMFLLQESDYYSANEISHLFVILMVHGELLLQLITMCLPIWYLMDILRKQNRLLLLHWVLPPTCRNG